MGKIKVPIPVPRAFLLYLLLLSAAAGCREPEIEMPPTPTLPPTAEIVRIGIEDSALPVALLIKNAFPAPDEPVSIQFARGNNAVLLADLDTGILDGLVTHYLPANSDYWFNPIAVDGLVVVAGPVKPVENVSRAELQAIFDGGVNNWSELGGPDLPVALYTREEGSAARSIFEERVMSGRALNPDAVVVTGEEQMLAEVSDIGGAIGYGMMGANDGANLITFDHYLANTTSTASQEYPLSVPIYFVTHEEPQGALRLLLSWLQSTAGQEVLGEKYGRIR